MNYFLLHEKHTHPPRLKKERARARLLKKTHWWQKKIQEGICHYCHKGFSSSELTMDHLVPLARGGKSTKGNLVPACHRCNQEKKLHTSLEWILKSKS